MLETRIRYKANANQMQTPFIRGMVVRRRVCALIYLCAELYPESFEIEHMVGLTASYVR